MAVLLFFVLILLALYNANFVHRIYMSASFALTYYSVIVGNYPVLTIGLLRSLMSLIFMFIEPIDRSGSFASDDKKVEQAGLMESGHLGEKPYVN